MAEKTPFKSELSREVLQSLTAFLRVSAEPEQNLEAARKGCTDVHARSIRDTARLDIAHTHDSSKEGGRNLRIVRAPRRSHTESSFLRLGLSRYRCRLISIPRQCLQL